MTALSSSSMTVKSTDGYTLTWALSSTTRVRDAGKKGSLSDLKTGETVRVLGGKSGDGANALVVGIPAPKAAGSASATPSASATTTS